MERERECCLLEKGKRTINNDVLLHIEVCRAYVVCCSLLQCVAVCCSVLQYVVRTPIHFELRISQYGVPTISRLLKMIGLLCRIHFLL